MKRLMAVLTVLPVFGTDASARMGDGQGSGMTDGGWEWGMNSGDFYMIIIAILAVLGVGYMYIMKRK